MLLKAKLAVWQKPEEQSPEKCDEWSISLPMISPIIMAKPLPRSACSRAFDVGSDYQLGGFFSCPEPGVTGPDTPYPNSSSSSPPTHTAVCALSRGSEQYLALFPLTSCHQTPGWNPYYMVRERERNNMPFDRWSRLKVLEYLTPFAKNVEAGRDWFNLSWSWTKLKRTMPSMFRWAIIQVKTA